MPKEKDKNHPAIAAIRDYLQRKGMSRPAFAEKAEIGEGTLNKLMSGDIPTDAILRRIEENVGIQILNSFQVVAHEELGAYPRSWCDDLIGEYLSIRQNRWRDKNDVINTYPVTFSWDREKPGLRMDWKSKVDKHYTKEQSAYISMTAKDGMLTIVSNNGGRISSTFLQRFARLPNRLFGLYCGIGQVGPGHDAIVAQVVAYVRKREIDFPHDHQVLPGAPGYDQFVKFLSSVEGAFCFIVRPPQVN